MTLTPFFVSQSLCARQNSPAYRIFSMFCVVLIAAISLWRPAFAQFISPVGENRSLLVSGLPLETGGVSLEGDFAISSWVYFNGDTPIDGSNILAQGNGWSVNFAGGVLAVNVDALGGTIAQTPSPIPIGRWAHFAVVRTDGHVDMYLNGNFEGDSRTGDSLSDVLLPEWRDPILLTSFFSGISGAVDDVRIYDGAREQSDVQSDLIGELENTEDLIRHYSFDGYSGVIVDETARSASLNVPLSSQFSGFLAPFVVPNVSNEFSEVQVASGLELPTDLGFLPDGRMIVLEKSGLVRLYADPAVANGEDGIYLDLSAETNNVAERGLLAVAVDPNFAINNYVYLYNTFLNQNNTIQKSVVRFSHVERNGGASSFLDPASARTIWREKAVALSSAANVHHGGGLAIAYEPIDAADPSPYKLYIVTSDESIPRSSADLSSDNGKVHRVNLSDGSIPTDNPYYNPVAAVAYNPEADVTTSIDANGILTTIHSFGIRNGWRASFDQQSQFLLIGEVGGSVQTGYEDIHIAVPLANYGWPTQEGPLSDPNDPGNPILSWNHAGGPGRNDTPTNGTSSVTGGVVYRGTKFPTEYHGAYFYGDWARRWVRYATFDFSGIRPVLLEDKFFRNAAGNVLSFEEAPDGTLYYITTNQTDNIFTFAGQVNRVDFEFDNSAPFGSGILVDDADLISGVAPHIVQFGANVYDSEGDVLNYAWDFGDGVVSAAASPLHTYNSSGDFEVSLVVTDANGAVSTFPTVSIRVGVLPQVTITASQEGTYRAGDSITVDGFAIDSIDGRLNTGQYLTWGSQYFTSGGSRPGPFENGTAYTPGGITFTTPNTGNVESFLTSVSVTLQAQNSQGLSANNTITLTAEVSSITVDAPNEDVLIAIDGHITKPGDYIFEGVVNFLFDFEAQSSYLDAGELMVFSHWSDDPTNTNPVRKIAMPATATTIVPVYVRAVTTTPVGQACFFDNADFSYEASTGANFRACSAAFRSTFSDRLGHNNTISALSVGAGVHTIIYEEANFTGSSLCLSENTVSGALGALFDLASSFEIVSGGDCPTIDSAPVGEVCFFDNADFSSSGLDTGVDFRTCIGEFASEFSDVKEHDNTISAISVGEGMHTFIYEGVGGTGESLCLSENTDTNALGNLLDQASYFEVISGGQCPPEPTDPIKPVTADRAPANQVCFYDNADFSSPGNTNGDNFRTCTGEFATNFSDARGHDNTIAGIAVGSGVHTIIYEGVNFTGASLCISESTDSSALGALSDQASSFEVELGGECSTPNPAPAGQVCFFDNADFSSSGLDTGVDFRTCIGEFASEFSDVKEHDNTISAISVGEGMHTFIYEGVGGTGESLCLSENTDTNALGNLLDQASYFEVISGGQCPPEPTDPIKPVTADRAPANQVCFYDNADFSSPGNTNGDNFRTCTGEFATNFSDARGHDNTIAGIAVGSGVHTIIYEGVNFTGASLCISESTDSSALGALSDQASSFEVELGGECSTPNPAPAGQVCFFDNADFSSIGNPTGANFRTCAGVFEAEFDGKGHNNSISAISVGAGMHTIIYDSANHTGESLCLSENTDSNALGGLVDRASSFAILSGSQCPEPSIAAAGGETQVTTGVVVVGGGAVSMKWLWLMFPIAWVRRRTSQPAIAESSL